MSLLRVSNKAMTTEQIQNEITVTTNSRLTFVKKYSAVYIPAKILIENIGAFTIKTQIGLNR